VGSYYSSEETTTVGGRKGLGRVLTHRLFLELILPVAEDAIVVGAGCGRARGGKTLLLQRNWMIAQPIHTRREDVRRRVQVMVVVVMIVGRRRRF